MTELKPFFPGLHALRVVAASFVVYEHASYVANGYVVDQARLFPFGRIGVILFFAISGFVIALQRTKPVGEFVKHRLLRIYPSYWIARAVETACWLALAKPVGTIAAAILLYPSTSGDDFTSIPYWTLVFEVVFYALATVAFALRLSDQALTALAVIWIVAVNLFAPNPSTGLEYALPGWLLPLSSAVQVFPMGLLVGIHFDRIREFGRWRYILGAGLALLASYQFPNFSTLELFTKGLSAAFLIAAVADTRWPALVKTLGDASYGIYLLHFPAIIVTAALFSTKIGIGWFLAAGMIAGTAFGIFDHWLYRRLTGIGSRSGVRLHRPSPL
jgi:peptidoglycan/LPS O-acetylase OafA/YrhL